MKKKSSNLNNVTTSIEDKIKELIGKAETLTKNLMNPHHALENASNTKPKSKLKNIKSSKRRGNFMEEQIEEKEIVAEIKISKNYLFSQPAILQNGTLKPFQLDGLNWLISLYENDINGILADEMGLGKTIQTISLIAYLIEFKSIKRPFLIITPKSTVPNWLKEFKKWLPNINALFLSGIREEREDALKLIKKKQFDVIVTTYEGAKRSYMELRNIVWEYFIIDEGHKIKNEECMLSLVVRDFMAKKKLLLTGTPLQNNIHELWSLLNFLLPELFASSELFDSWFSENENINELTNEEKEKRNIALLTSLNQIINPFILRRVKIDVEKTLPPKKEIYIYVGLTEIQQSMYKNMLKKKAVLNDATKNTYLNIVMQLIKICNHPYIFEDIEQDDQPLYGDHLINVSGKMLVLDKLLNKLHKEKHQVLIFSQMTFVLDILEDYCNYREYTFCRIDGSTSLLDRETQMNDFNAEDSKLFIFLLSTRSGGLGINLTAADTVILYDSDWNPQMDLQAMDRAHRIGQKNIVNVYRFITKGTVEERLNEKQLYKLKWDSLIVRNNKERSNNHFSKEDFNKMIDFGVSEIFASEKGTYTDEDIDLILRRGEEKAEENSKKLEEYFKKHKDLLNLTKPEDDYSLYNFNDINYSKIRNQDLKIINELRKEEFTKSEPQSTRKRMLLLSNSSETNMENLSLEEIQKLQNIQNKVVKRFPIHHFYENRDRLIDLESKQIAYSIYNQKNKLDENLLMLEPSEIEEKNKLIQTGFTNWTHSDIKGLLQAFDKFQKNDFKGIAKFIGKKNEEEIEKYLKVFFERIEELPYKQRVLVSISKIEAKIVFAEQAKELVKRRIESYENGNEDELNFELARHMKNTYIRSTNKNWKQWWNPDIDKYLLLYINVYGYDNVTKIRESLLKEKMFKFDHFLKTRKIIEIQSRMLKIINCLEKIEAEALAKNKQKEGVEITIQEIIPRTTSNIKLNQNLSQSKLDNFLKKSDQEISKKEENSNKKDSKEELEWSKLKSSSSDLKKSALKRERAENAENYIKDDLKKKKNLK